MAAQRYVQKRATSKPEGVDPDLMKKALQIANRRPDWVPGSGGQATGPVANPYIRNQNAPSLTGLSPTGRFNDMRARREALYRSLIPNGQQVVDGEIAPLTAAAAQDQQLDVQSGIGRGTDVAGNPTAVTPLGGRITTTQRPTIAPIPAMEATPADPLYDVEAFPGRTGVAGIPAATIQTLNSPYGAGSSIDTGTVPLPNRNTIGMQMASGNTRYLPMRLWRTPQGQGLQDKETTIANDGGTADDNADFQDMLDKLKAANTKDPLRK